MKLRAFKYIFWVSFLFISGFFLVNCKAITYGIRQGMGQVKVLTDTTPIDELLNDPAYPDSLKAKIRLIQEIKQFTVDSLGLNPSGSYEKLYDQHGEPLIWMMTASEPYNLTPYEWKFPFVGTFTYKGHFKKQLAVEELDQLKKQGYDTRLGRVAAWSTLGYFNDPILSEMLTYDDGNLAALIIHELTHGTLYVKNDVQFNENLADFVGDYGAVKFLESKFGPESEQLQQYQKSLKINELYNQSILRGAKQLQDLYGTNDFQQQPDSVKLRLKNQQIWEIMTGADSLLSEMNRPKFNWQKNLPNNAYFVTFINYQSKQNTFREEFKNKFNGDFRAYMEYLRENYGKNGLGI